MFKIFVFACILAIAAAGYVAPAINSYAYGVPYAYTGSYAAPHAYSAYPAYRGYGYNGYAAAPYALRYY